MINPERTHRDDEEFNIREEAGALLNQQQEKTFGERIISEYQTRKANIRGTEIERGEAFRWERGQIYKAYMNLRKEIREAEDRGENSGAKKELLKAMRERAKIVEKDLDELNRQFYENIRTVDLETEFGAFSMPVVELDLKKDASGQSLLEGEDTRVPDFFLGSVATQAHQSACFSMARALEGHRVFIPMQVEQPSVKKSEDFSRLLSERGDLKPYASVAKATIQQLGLKNFNLLGFSSGAAQALEVATDTELKGLNDLVVIEPLGIEDKGIAKLGMEFGLKQGFKTIAGAEDRIKTLKQGASEGQGDIGLLLKTAQILAKRHFDVEKLSKINPSGRFQVWVGNESPIVNSQLAQDLFLEAEHGRPKTASPLEFYEVAGADHGLGMMNALGLSKMIDGKKSEEQVTRVHEKDLGHSAMEWLLKDIEKAQ